MIAIDYNIAVLVSSVAIAASCFCLVYIFATSLWRAREHWRWFRYREDTAAAIAKVTIFSAGGVSRVSGAVIIKLRIEGHDSTWYEDHVHTVVVLYTGFIFVMGAACLARVYSDSNKEWLTLAAVTAACCVLAVVVPLPL